jgi:beta-glucanase (GH16 family)
MIRARALARALASVAAVSLLASCTHGSSGASAAVQPSPPPPSYVSGLGSGWTMPFDATFTGSGLNTSVWAACYPWGSAAGCTNFGNKNEYEWYLPSQDQVYGNALHLIAQRIPTPGLASDGTPKEYSFRSGIVTTFPSYRFQYGYVQVVARIPYAEGLWPALWLAAANQQWPPEIDILEHYGVQADYSQHLHPVDSPVQASAESSPNLSVGWHVFGLYWSQYRIIWFVDGHPVMSATQAIPQQPMYFIANLAVYQQDSQGWPPGSDGLVIQSVKVWQSNYYQPPATAER